MRTSEAVRGRPRRVATDAAIHAATRSLLADVGYGELTIEGVARLAGVGKPTIYRRHDSKASLVAAALVETLEDVNPAVSDTGDAAADLRGLLGNLAVALGTDFGRAMREIVSPAARDEHLAELFEAATADRRTLIRSVMQRADSDGRLLVDDPETAIDLALGAIYFRHLITRDPVDGRFLDGVVSAVVSSPARSADSA